MQYSNFGNDGIAKLWGYISEGRELEAGTYSADSNKNFTLHIGHAGCATLYSYEAPIRKRVYNRNAGQFEYWINDASYSVTTSKHQSLARRHEEDNPRAYTFDFTVFDNVFEFKYNIDQSRGAFIKPAGIRAKQLVDGFVRFINTPRRQKRTIAREAVERGQGMRDLCHIIEFSCNNEDDIDMYHMMEDYASAFEQCAEFGGVKEIFEAVHALNKG